MSDSDNQEKPKLELRDVWHVLSRSCGEQQYRSPDGKKYALADAACLAAEGEPVTIWKTSEVVQ